MSGKPTTSPPLHNPVRRRELEINHKLSLMGIFYAIQVQQIRDPVKIVTLTTGRATASTCLRFGLLTPIARRPVADRISPFEVPHEVC